jgi:hypothetical protein
MKFNFNPTHIRNSAIAASLIATCAAASAADMWLYSGRDFTGATARVNRSECRALHSR